MDQATIRRRLATLRDARKVSQDQLATVLGFNDRQTVSDIEGGKRVLAFAELAKAAEYLGVNIDYFTDPLQLAGEAKFSWRQLAAADENLNAFEEKAGTWIATYRYLSRLRGQSVNSSLTQVGLTIKSTFEEARVEGDAVARTLELGEVPAATLSTVLQEKLDTLVLHVDMSPGLSGAASQLGPLNVIIINRREVEGRRNFDMAHEFFHLITWAQMPPLRIEGTVKISPRYARIERLADNFAAGLLMPVQSMAKRVEDNPLPAREAELAGWIRTSASHFRVSGDALKWRLASLGYITQAAADRLAAVDVRVNLPGGQFPPRFSSRFVETLGWGIEKGHLSVRRASEVIGETIDDLADLFSEHGQKAPFDI